MRVEANLAVSDPMNDVDWHIRVAADVWGQPDGALHIEGFTLLQSCPGTEPDPQSWLLRPADWTRWNDDVGLLFRRAPHQLAHAEDALCLAYEIAMQEAKVERIEKRLRLARQDLEHLRHGRIHLDVQPRLKVVR